VKAMVALPSLVLALALLGVGGDRRVIAGVVRDQRGDPVAGAIVRAAGVRDAPVLARTDPDGTFAFEESGTIGAVEITCAYCRAILVRVASDGTVVAVVHRYRALVSWDPGTDDLAALPYDHVESLLSLAPFVALATSGDPLNAARIAVDGDPLGTTLAVNGVALDDPLAGAADLALVPLDDATAVRAHRDEGAAPGGAYGAASGLEATPFDERTGARLTTGTGAAGALSIVGGDDAGRSAIAGGASLSPRDRRRRVDLVVTHAGTISGLDAAFVAGAADAHESGAFAQSTAYAALRVHDERMPAASARFSMTRGTIGAAAASGAWWSLDEEVRWRPDAMHGPFASIEATQRSASSPGSDPWRAPATRSGTAVRVLLGERARAGAVALVTGAAADDAFSRYGGLGYGMSVPYGGSGTTRYAAVAPFVRATVAAGAHWNGALAASERVREAPLDALAVSDAASDGRPFDDRIAHVSAVLAYGDLHRVRAEAMQAFWRTRGFDALDAHGSGVAAAWQIAPRIALRGWWMRASIVQRAAYPPLQPVPPFPSGSYGALWATIALGTMRADVIWRHDLFDGAPDPHLDAALSGPLAGPARWLVGTERYRGRRSLILGIRFARD